MIYHTLIQLQSYTVTTVREIHWATVQLLVRLGKCYPDSDFSYSSVGPLGQASQILCIASRRLKWNYNEITTSSQAQIDVVYLLSPTGNNNMFSATIYFYIYDQQIERKKIFGCFAGNTSSRQANIEFSLISPRSGGETEHDWKWMIHSCRNLYDICEPEAVSCSNLIYLNM